jgi:predicted RNase H-like HicB family nuclease
MQINVLVEPMNGKGFRATGCEPFAISAEGGTREEALARLKESVQARLKAGAEIVPLEIEAADHPLLKYAGIFKDDPHIEEWKKAMAQYRDEVEKDDNYL